MPWPIKLLLLAIAGLASAAAQAQLLGPAFESNITLTRDDLDKMRQTVPRKTCWDDGLLGQSQQQELGNDKAAEEIHCP